MGLIDAGEKIVVVDNLSTGFAWAVPAAATLAVGDFGDSELIARLIDEHEVDAIAHFAAKIVVPESVADPLGYYLNNTSKARNLIECAVKRGRPQFHLLVDRRGLWRDDFRAGRRKRRPQSDVAVWALETDGRMDARRRRARP